MANRKHERILKKGVSAWNAWRYDKPDVAADLSGADLSMMRLSGARLVGTDLGSAKLKGTKLNEGQLHRANLRGADLTEADLARADLRGADMSEAVLTRTIFTDADLTRAHFVRADLKEADLSGAHLAGARIGWTMFADLDLSNAHGLDAINHVGPSTISIDVIRKSNGHIPPIFLQGCGFAPWEIELALLYDPGLSPSQIADVLDTKVFRARTDGPLYLGGIFISYSHADSQFVDKLHDRLAESGAHVWLDLHDLLAGDLQKQIFRAIRLQDVVIVVLSQDSIGSDWVEHELEMARAKEKAEKRDVLCPVALDDGWKEKLHGDVLWRQLKKKNVLDFSGWRTSRFDAPFNKLVDGIKVNYPHHTPGAEQALGPASHNTNP